MAQLNGTLGVEEFARPARQTQPQFSFRKVLKAIVDVITFHWVVRLVERQLHKQLRAMGLAMEYSDIHLHLRHPGLRFKQVRVTSTKRASMLGVQLGEVDVQMRWKDLLARRFTFLSRIRVHDGNITIHELDAFKKAYIPAQPPGTIKAPPSKAKKKGWMIRDLDIENLRVVVEGDQGGSVHIESFVGSWQAKFYDLGIRFGVMNQPLRFIIRDLHITTLFKWHGFSLDAVGYDMEKKEIRFEGAHIYPHVEPDYMDQHEPHISMHMDLKVPEVVITGLDWSHMDVLHWQAERIDVTQPTFWAYQNREKALRKGMRPMPTHWGNALPFRFMVETVQVHEGSLTYTFTPASDKEIGRLSISELNLTWEGYGNDMLHPTAFSAQASMRWMEDAMMNVSVFFPNDDSTSSFKLEGDLGAADFVQFNPVTIVAGGLHFVSGHWDVFKFRFEGNEEHIRGQVQVAFDDVKVGFEEDQERGFFDELKTVAANTFVMRHSTHGRLREVEVFDRREVKQTVFAMWLMGLMTGFRKALLKV
jgi:hypothetical protein